VTFQIRRCKSPRLAHVFWLQFRVVPEEVVTIRSNRFNYAPDREPETADARLPVHLIRVSRNPTEATHQRPSSQVSHFPIRRHCNCRSPWVLLSEVELLPQAHAAENLVARFETVQCDAARLPMPLQSLSKDITAI
jgi:hypothetical protein